MRDINWGKARHLFLCFLLLVLFAALDSCAPVRITPPEMELAGIEIGDVSITHLNLNAQFRIYNPNRESIRIGAVNYEMEVNGEPIFSSVTYVDDSLGPGEYMVVPLRISSAFWDLVAMFSSMGTGQALDFRISGSVEAGKSMGRMSTFDFEHSGKLDVTTPNSGRGHFKQRPAASPLPSRGKHRSPESPMRQSGDYI